jgi:hypothetical protein
MTLVPTAVSQAAGRAALSLNASSPKLLFGVGVAGMIGSTVLACRATLKLEEVLEEVQSDLHAAKGTRELHEDRYSEKELKKDTAVIVTRGVLGVVRLYGPAIIVGSVGVACLTKSHNLLQERNAALAAAYTAIDKAFNRYRERVVEKHGEDEDRYFRYGSEDVEVIDEETGKVVTVTRVSNEEPSMYARFFDQLSPSWNKEPEYNLVFLRCQQNWANDLLKTRGHVFLNEVYDMLGIPRTKAGQVVGWCVSDEGDNFIDFGIYDNQDRVRDFVNGREGAILLDFNVDGIIHHKIENHGEGQPWQS